MTYVRNMFIYHMQYMILVDYMIPSFKGIQIIPSRAASDEMIKYGLLMEDIIEILNDGYDCYRRKRKENIIERCIDKKEKTLKVVISKVYYYSLNEEVWILTHVGKITKRR